MAAGPVLLPDKLQVLILGSEWGSSKGGESTINRELAVNLAKCPEAHVSFFVPQCNDEEKKVARDHKITLIKAKPLRGMAEHYWLLSPPPDLHIDVVVGHGVDLGPQAQFIREARKCKWIQVVHKNPEEIGMFRTGRDSLSESEKEHEDEVALCEEADFVVTVGPKLTEAFRAYLRSCNQTIFEFTPGILQDVSNVHQVADEGNTFRVLLCGRGNTNDFPLQGFDIAGKAVALSDSHLVFVGAEENKNEIKTHFRKDGIKSLTVRSKLKDRQRLNKLLCEVDLAVMPTRGDGFGVIGLEALSAGLPVLVSRNSGFGEALDKVLFGSSFVIDSEDAFDDAQAAQEWAKMIKKVKGKDRSQRLKESEALRTFYDEKYSWEKQSKELIKEIVKMFQDASIGCQSSTEHRTSKETEGPEGSLPMTFALKSAIFQEGKSGDPKCLMHEMITQFVNTTKTPGNLAEKILKTLYGYLTTVRDLVVILVTEGSLRVTVKCKTPEVLEGLWKDYRSGNLNAEAEKRLLTDDTKREFHVVSVKLQTTIRIVDYLACKLFLTSFPQSDEDQTTDETQTQLIEEPEPVTQHADVKCATDRGTHAPAPGGSNQLQTEENELKLTKKQINEQLGQEKEFTQEQNPTAKVQTHFRTEKKQSETTREQLNEHQELGELLQQEQNRVTELQSQLGTMKGELETTRTELNEYQGKEQLLRQQIHELQSQLRIRTEELETTTKELSKYQEIREQELESEKSTLELLRLQEQDVCQLQTQLKTTDPRNWVIHRSEIKFETKQLLEKGAWGPVFRVPFYGRNVAVKQMFPASQIGVTRDFFERQAEIASKCHHPCLLEFIGATADNQPPFFVTELMGNDCSLKTRLYPRGYLKEEPTLTEEDVVVISLDVAQALNYLHQKPLSIIHHNISSGKVLLWRRDEQWRAKVSGYETMNFVRYSLGKDVRYRAPELLTNDPSQPISCKVDVYSFGVLLCEMSIRQEPDPQQRRMQIAQIINRHFRELVQHCVKEEPEGRPNMEEVIEDLRNLISLHHPNLLLKLGK